MGGFEFLKSSVIWLRRLKIESEKGFDILFEGQSRIEFLLDAPFDSRSKIVIIGTSGAGKTTLARRLAERFSLEDIELDALFWEPQWSQASPDIFRSRIVEAMNKKPVGLFTATTIRFVI